MSISIPLLLTFHPNIHLTLTIIVMPKHSSDMVFENIRLTMFRVTTIVVCALVMLPTVAVSQETTIPYDYGSDYIFSDGQIDPDLRGPSTESIFSDEPGPDVHTHWENDTNSELQRVQTHNDSDGHYWHYYSPIDRPDDLCHVAHIDRSFINPANKSCIVNHPSTICYGNCGNKDDVSMVLGNNI